MFSWILQTTLISIIFILIVHHLIIYFKENLTSPKVRDLVNVPAKKYQEILDIVSKNDNTFNYSNEKLISEDNGKLDTLSMKNELKSFLKEQYNKSNSFDNTTLLNNLQSTATNNNYSLNQNYQTNDYYSTNIDSSSSYASY